MRLGHLDVQPLVDGYFTAPDDFFGDADLTTHSEILDLDGRLRLPIGCFLVRSGERLVLIDAGVGPVHDEMFDGGGLLDALAGIGVGAGDLDLVVCSHLHLDHCGWLIDRHSQPVFPSATLAVGAGDWRYFVEDEAGFMRRSIRAGLLSLAEAGRVDLLEGDAELAPGLTVTAAPGHTPGHACVVLSSGAERLLLLGTRSIARFSLRRPTGASWPTSTRISPPAPVSACGASWRVRACAVPVPTSRSSGSAGCSRGAGAAGGPRPSSVLVCSVSALAYVWSPCPERPPAAPSTCADGGGRVH